MRGGHVILVLALLGLAGCQPLGGPPGKAGPPEVKGKVVDSDGNPLARVGVVFLPQDEANKGLRVLGLTQPDGSFRAACPLGRYKVILTGVAADPPKMEEKGKGKVAPPKPSLPAGVPARYGSEKETPWEVDVPAGGKSGLVLKVEAE
jgi:hypothetical protein